MKLTKIASILVSLALTSTFVSIPAFAQDIETEPETELPAVSDISEYIEKIRPRLAEKMKELGDDETIAVSVELIQNADSAQFEEAFKELLPESLPSELSELDAVDLSNLNEQSFAEFFENSKPAFNELWKNVFGDETQLPELPDSAEIEEILGTLDLDLDDVQFDPDNWQNMIIELTKSDIERIVTLNDIASLDLPDNWKIDEEFKLPFEIPKIPLTDIIIGDIDNDGNITAADALEVLRISFVIDDDLSELLKLADVDGDGEITSADALLILRYSTGYISGLLGITE